VPGTVGGEVAHAAQLHVEGDRPGDLADRQLAFHLPLVLGAGDGGGAEGQAGAQVDVEDVGGQHVG